MFDVGWSELTLLGVVALVVIGPKDLPKVLRTVGSYTRKARSIAREFQNSVEDMLREAELEDVKKSLDAARNFDLNAEINKSIDPDGSLRQHLAPPVMPSLTSTVPLDQQPSRARGQGAAAGEAIIHDPVAHEPAGDGPTIHTPIGSDPSLLSPSGLDPHPAPVLPAPALDPHPPSPVAP